MRQQDEQEDGEGLQDARDRHGSIRLAWSAMVLRPA
jgi:hypothetical protein